MTITIETAPKVLAEGFSFTECPHWRDGWLYFSDMRVDLVTATRPANVPRHDMQQS